MTPVAGRADAARNVPNPSSRPHAAILAGSAGAAPRGATDKFLDKQTTTNAGGQKGCQAPSPPVLQADADASLLRPAGGVSQEAGPASQARVSDAAQARHVGAAPLAQHRVHAEVLCMGHRGKGCAEQRGHRRTRQEVAASRRCHERRGTQAARHPPGGSLREERWAPGSCSCASAFMLGTEPLA